MCVGNIKLIFLYIDEYEVLDFGWLFKVIVGFVLMIE